MLARCRKHDLALGPDGRCILCKRSVPPPRSSRPPARSSQAPVAATNLATGASVPPIRASQPPQAQLGHIPLPPPRPSSVRPGTPMSERPKRPVTPPEVELSALKLDVIRWTAWSVVLLASAAIGYMVWQSGVIALPGGIMVHLR